MTAAATILHSAGLISDQSVGVGNPNIKKIDLIVYHHNKHATKFPFLCDCSIARSVGPYTLILLPRGGETSFALRRRFTL
eukprot:COSAG01_NODE_82_length_27810_cov_36.968352_24_plen_80_part_00